MSFAASSVVITPARTTLAVSAPKRAAPARALVVKASSQETSRRAVLSLAAASLALVADKASALSIPSQDSSGGITKPKNNSSRGSMSGYTMEGTNKGGLSAKGKKKLLANTRAQALKDAQKK